MSDDRIPRAGAAAGPRWVQRSSGWWWRVGVRLKAAVENAFSLFPLGRSW
jgi:hypothetical protein